jgi:hypothetical protein
MRLSDTLSGPYPERRANWGLWLLVLATLIIGVL